MEKIALAMDKERTRFRHHRVQYSGNFKIYFAHLLLTREKKTYKEKKKIKKVKMDNFPSDMLIKHTLAHIHTYTKILRI